MMSNPLRELAHCSPSTDQALSSDSGHAFEMSENPLYESSTDFERPHPAHYQERDAALEYDHLTPRKILESHYATVHEVRAHETDFSQYGVLRPHSVSLKVVDEAREAGNARGHLAWGDNADA